MKIGLQIPSFTWNKAIASTLKEISQTADRAGFYSVWVMDHFFQLAMLGDADQPMLEGYSTLNYLAALTENVKLGTLVTGIVYRYPGILAKTATTLDVLSEGRAYLGIGAAWYDREADGLGVPFPSVSDRFEQLEETLQIVKQMWSDNNGTYTGQHFKLQETLNNPAPISQPHPPIMIGGMGEKKTLRLVAQYADATNLFLMAGAETLAKKLDILQEHCDVVGRDYAEIEKTALGTVHLAPDQMSKQQVIDLCGEHAELGFSHLIFNMPFNLHEIKPLEIFGQDIIPIVAEI